MYIAALVLALAQYSVLAKIPTVSVYDDYFVMANGYVSLKINTVGGAWISELYGDYSGQSKFVTNLLSQNGIRLERENADMTVSSNADAGTDTEYIILANTGTCAKVEIPEVYDDSLKLVKESWILSLCEYDRSFKLEVSGSTTGKFGNELRNIRHGLYSNLISTTAFFEAGVVQILNAPTPQQTYFASTNPNHRVYLLGSDGNNNQTNGCVDILGNHEGNQVVLLNSNSMNLGFRSGFHDILIGTAHNVDEWSSGYTAEDNMVLNEAVTYTRTWTISANDRNFPAGQLPNGSVLNMDNDVDVEAFMIGIYANSVPCLCTYMNEVTRGFQVAQIATTLRHENGRGYNHTYNYFDPDNYFSLSAILYSGDAYLQNQAKLVIERSGSFIKNSTGQLPHHFEGVQPTYLALSGETQTGPNTFWVKTALQYASVTGDYEWLAQYMTVLRTASNFVFDLIETDTHLLFAPGSLMIDVFIRNNYTSDSNSMVVGFLHDFAAAERLVRNEDQALRLQQEADQVTAAVNQHLWASSDLGGDHYITQLNADGSIRDFVDYDSNHIAIANGVSSEEQSRLIQKRIDGGNCSAASGAGAQYVSEVYYGTSDTTNGNVGDSACSMARIGWFDALGRKRFGTADDLSYVDNQIIQPLQRDVIQYTWLRERYGCDGLQQEWRTKYYFEYPAFVSMLTREIRYGITLGLTTVTIDPFTSNEAVLLNGYEYHIGNVDIRYSNSLVAVSVPGFAGQLSQYRITGMLSDQWYTASSSSSGDASACSVGNWAAVDVRADSAGVLSFTAPRGALPCTMTVVLKH